MLAANVISSKVKCAVAAGWLVLGGVDVVDWFRLNTCILCEAKKFRFHNLSKEFLLCHVFVVGGGGVGFAIALEVGDGGAWEVEGLFC